MLIAYTNKFNRDILMQFVIEKYVLLTILESKREHIENIDIGERKMIEP